VVRFEPGVGDQAVFSVGTGDEMAAADSAVPAAPARLPPAARYLEYFAEDAKLFCKVLNLTPGELLILSEALSDHELRATRLYRDWLRPRRLHHLVSLIVSRTPRHTTGLSLLRRPQGPGFAQRELDLLRRLHPHLQRVVELQDMLVTAERKSEAADRLLESLRCGAIVLDDRGQVSGANQRAAALLERGQGLRQEGGRLGPRIRPRRRRSSAWCGAPARAARPARAAPSRCRAPPTGMRSWFSVSPLRRDETRIPWLPGAGALVLVTDPEDLPALLVPALRKLYGLTEAEARVASRLARGETLDETAAALGVGRATVRTQLRQALAKTGTRRQAELIRLLLMGTGALAALGSDPPSES
jgi:DNA-binding CsgD family transcriptional regulator